MNLPAGRSSNLLLKSCGEQIRLNAAAALVRIFIHYNSKIN